MKYLVLRSFKSYDKRLEKGTIVDATEIRNARLRESEGKIFPVVSSSNYPEGLAEEIPKDPTGYEKESTIKLSFNKKTQLG